MSSSSSRLKQRLLTLLFLSVVQVSFLFIYFFSRKNFLKNIFWFAFTLCFLIPLEEMILAFYPMPNYAKVKLIHVSN